MGGVGESYGDGLCSWSDICNGSVGSEVMAGGARIYEGGGTTRLG